MEEFEKVIETYKKFEQFMRRDATEEEKRLIRFGYVTALTDLIGKKDLEKIMFSDTLSN